MLTFAEDLGDWDQADWGWNVDDDESPADEESHPSWLQDCCVSLSPTGELVALARESQLIVLEQRWDGSQKGEVQMKYTEVVNANLAMEEGWVEAWLHREGFNVVNLL